MLFWSPSILSCGVKRSSETIRVKSIPKSRAAAILLPGRGFKSFSSGVRFTDSFYGIFVVVARAARWLGQRIYKKDLAVEF